MRILITGATGFLGKEIVKYHQSHELITLSRSNSQINSDLTKEVPILVSGIDLVIHCAGKAHVVPSNEAERKVFFDVNVSGTKNLLCGISKLKTLPRSFVFISTVAVYGLECGTLIGEESALRAEDSYGLSKIEAENIVQKWCKANNVICTILRLPLLAGPYPPGNLKAMIKGISKGYYFDIDKGAAKKSIVLTSDVASIIISASEIGGIYNLTDMRNPTFEQISSLIAKQLGKPKPKSMPLWVAIMIAKIGDFFGKIAPLNSAKLRKIRSELTFNDSKACKNLNWKPLSVLEEFKIGSN